jgi:hypothetical protein
VVSAEAVPPPPETAASAAVTPTRVVLSPHLQSGPPAELTVWLIYGGFLETAHRVARQRAMSGDWLVHADLAARQLLAARILARDPRLNGVRSRYLRDALPRIAQAGFIREHALLDFSGSAGGVVEELPAERAAAYRGWLAAQSLGLVPETWAALRVEGTLMRRIPRRDGPLATTRMQASLPP